MSDLATLKRKRGSVKSSLTSFNKFLDTLTSKQKLTDLDILILKERLENNSKLLSQFNDLHSEIEIISDDDTLSEQETEKEHFEEKFYTVIGTAKLLLQKHDVSASSSSNTGSNHLYKCDSGGIKFPDIALPKFNGKFEEWLEFRDTFDSLIHSNEKLTAIQKLLYLRSALEGAAAAIIKNISHTADNYAVAWDTLCKRFNNDKKLLHDHIAALYFSEPIQKGSYEKLQKLADDISKHLGAIEKLGQSIENWDFLLIFHFLQKMDNASVFDWEKQTRNKTESPTLKEFLEFLRERANFVDSLDYKSHARDKTSNKFTRDFVQKTKRETSRTLISSSSSKHYRCSFCKGEHSIYTCKNFLNLTGSDRVQFVKKHSSICANCLREGHPIHKCRMGPCKKCGSRHNTLLHDDASDIQSRDTSNAQEQAASNVSGSLVSHPIVQTVLSTARVLVADNKNNFHLVRALLDCGSQTSFITEQLQSKLNIAKQDANLSIFGIANSVSTVKAKCQVSIKSQHNNFTARLICYVLPEITAYLPSSPIRTSSLKIPSHIKLADSEPFKPAPIDMLIGADLFWQILGPNKLTLGDNLPCLQETTLGWIICGQIGVLNTGVVSCNLSANQELLQMLTKFWELEELTDIKVASPDEILYEKIFSETTTRNQGRFVVSMPLKQNPESLSESRAQAERRFHALERRLQKNPKLHSMYKDFMEEYTSLGHMSLVCDANDQNIQYYMPHHGVIKETSLTTKLRVVFDASAPTSNGISLNNIQIIGPTLQDGLFSIILRFRKYPYVISADIEKMYRQVLIQPNQRPLQRILWRNRTSDPLQTYQLNTVIYGQASASFLSIRCLSQLAEDISFTMPSISRIIKQDFYVDDMLTGADSIQEAQEICKEVSNVLKKGCFNLRKWCSNEPEVLRHVDEPDRAYKVLEFSDTTKTLGLTWSCRDDNLLYHIDTCDNIQRVTKRTVLSSISKIFDPLGLVSPCTVLTKILMQELWGEGLSWDEDLPPHLLVKWETFQRELPLLNNLAIARHVLLRNYSVVEVHGFCDASERAYGACIYLRSLDTDGRVYTSLLCAKSKVAPMKTVTIPRLELCAAVLLARLTNTVLKAIDLPIKGVFLWSDSTITLAWIRTSPNLLKTFTGNRVSEIQTLTQNCQWKHVSTRDNPADIVSRGLYPSQILESKIYWKGPPWLLMSASDWPNEPINVSDVPELKSHTILTNALNEELHFPFERFSSFTKIHRVTAYILRFKNNCLKSKESRINSKLTLSELNYASRVLIRICQYQSFFPEVQELQRGKHLKAKNKLAGLTPFLDEHNIVRVGGRLKYSHYEFNKKHPILLHSKHHFTKLLFRQQHISLLHAGPQLLLSTIRNKYWPISGRNLARATVRECIRCFRFNAETVQPIMGNLPNDRVAPSSPFSITGIDYAGPFLIKDKASRGYKITKCYLGLFVCFATKAVHLELISSLSSEAFLQALRRFASRRGKPSKIYSDNGTNFVGAQRELGLFLKSENTTNQISNFAISESIDWQFIPPYSPHFGGLWEAGVRSSKHHLKRVLSDTPLTFEELCTIFAQIEAILNSRPISPLSSDPNDHLPLTPAHFLIGRPMISVPDENLTDLRLNRLNRYQMVQQMCQHFWRRWKDEYLCEMQERKRWKQTQGTLSEGTLVLIKEDHNPPTYWKLGRIVAVHPGADGICRVASIKTSSGVIKRSFQKICPLPLDD